MILEYPCDIYIYLSLLSLGDLRRRITHVSDEVRKDYLGGEEKREWLEIALLEAIKVHGTDRKLYNRVKERFCWKGWGYLVRHIYIFIYFIACRYLYSFWCLLCACTL